jgi:hypothetical protein
MGVDYAVTHVHKGPERVKARPENRAEPCEGLETRGISQRTTGGTLTVGTGITLESWAHRC